jgi:hypothetical protein
MKRKILFLDIDGVLIPKESYPCFSPRAVANLLALLENEPELEICITSERRKFLRPPALFSMRAFFRANIPSFDSYRIVGVTPTRWFGGRGREIEEWLSYFAPDAAFAILDDKKNLHPFLNRAIITDPRIGLSEDDANMVSVVLREQEQA